jgi:hypothetical protein
MRRHNKKQTPHCTQKVNLAGDMVGCLLLLLSEKLRDQSTETDARAVADGKK